jgi:hypothetical protein
VEEHGSALWQDGFVPGKGRAEAHRQSRKKCGNRGLSVSVLEQQGEHAGVDVLFLGHGIALLE